MPEHNLHSGHSERYLKLLFVGVIDAASHTPIFIIRNVRSVYCDYIVITKILSARVTVYEGYAVSI